MANVQVIQRHAHLATAVALEFVNGRDGQIAKAVLTAISNTRRGSGSTREDEATAIRWTLWGKQAENAAQYLTKGSHVNIVGRVQNNNYDKDGTAVYAMAFTAEEIDYLDTKADGQAMRARQDQQGQDDDAAPAAKPAAPAVAPNVARKPGGTPGRTPASSRKGAAKSATAEHSAATDDIPF